MSSSRWLRINLWVHRWASMVAVLPFLILCLTGTVLIFHKEIDQAMGIAATTTAGNQTQPLQPPLDHVLTNNPDKRILSVGIDVPQYPGLLLAVTTDKSERSFDQVEFHFSDLVTAKPVSKVNPHSTLTGFLLKLHSQWFLGMLGELIGAFIALLMILSLLSGLIVYAPYVKRIAFGIIRKERHKRILQLDLHNLIGCVVFGWLIIVLSSGFFLGFGGLAIKFWQFTELSELQTQYQHLETENFSYTPNLDSVTKVATENLEAGWKVNTVIFPDTELSTPYHYSVVITGPEQTLDERLFQVMLIDASNYKIAATRQLPWYLKAIALAQPLHFGDYGGLTLKIIWTLCTWLTLFISLNGAWLWWQKRKESKTKLTEEKLNEG